MSRQATEAQSQAKRRKPATFPGNLTDDSVSMAFAGFLPEETLDYLSFCGKIRGSYYYEVWYFKEREWYVSFIVYDESGDYRFVQSPAVLIHEMAEDRRIADEILQSLKDGRVKLYVASIAFLISLGVLLYMAVTQASSNASVAVLSAIVGVVSSGAFFFFGVWIPGGVGRRPPRRQVKSAAVG